MDALDSSIHNIIFDDDSFDIFDWQTLIKSTDNWKNQMTNFDELI